MACSGCKGAALVAPVRKPVALAAEPDPSMWIKLGLVAAVGVLIWSALK